MAYPGHDVEYNGLVRQGSAVPVNVKAFEADEKHPEIDVWMFGDWSQEFNESV